MRQSAVRDNAANLFSLLVFSSSHLLLLLRQLVLNHFNVEYHVERVIVIRHERVQAGQIEVVLDVVLVDLHEELVAAEGAEPCYPGGVVRAGGGHGGGGGLGGGAGLFV